MEKEDLVLAAFANAFRTPDLRKKLLFVLLIIAIFRLGSQPCSRLPERASATMPVAWSRARPRVR